MKNLITKIFLIILITFFNSSLFSHVIESSDLDVEIIYWDKWKHITEDVYIPNGTRLLITSGTVVRFAPGIELRIYGEISAHGEIGNPIIFTSDRLNKSRGDWKGIIIGAAEEASFDLCLVEYAETGLLIVATNDIDVSSCVFANNSDSGIDSRNSAAEIHNCILFSNGFAGFRSQSGDCSTLVNSISSNNNGVGISVDQASPTIDYNDVWDNPINYSGISPGPHDISSAPLFIDPGENDFRLNPFDSPCLNAGDSGEHIGAHFFPDTYVPTSSPIPYNSMGDPNWGDKWFLDDLPIPYYINHDSFIQNGLTYGEIDAVILGVRDWQLQTGSRIRFEYMGHSTANFQNLTDGINVLEYSPLPGGPYVEYHYALWDPLQEAIENGVLWRRMFDFGIQLKTTSPVNFRYKTSKAIGFVLHLEEAPPGIPSIMGTEYTLTSYDDDAAKFLYPVIGSCPDINADGIVDIFDIVTVASHFGLSSSDEDWYSRADCKPDGEIDIFDVVLVATRIE
jgi:hypothetical protein